MAFNICIITVFYLLTSTTLHKMANKIDVKREKLYISDAAHKSKDFKMKAFETFLKLK